MLGLLPQIERKDRKARPYGGSRRTFGQHSTQREPAFEQADASFDAAPESLKLFEPATVLMSFLGPTQPANLWNPDSTDSQPTKLVQVLRAVIATIGGQLSGRLFENLLSLSNQRNKLGLVTGIATMNLVMNDYSRGVLDQLQGSTKLHRLIELAFHYSPGLGIKERNNALRDSFASKFVLSLLNKLCGELDSLAKLLPEGGGRRCRHLLESLATLGQRIGCQSGYFLEDLFTLGFTFFGLGFRTGSPAGQGFLGGSHMADNLLPQRTRPTAKRSHRLVEYPDIGGIGDMGFQGRRVDANPPRFNRSMLD